MLIPNGATRRQSLGMAAALVAAAPAAAAMGRELPGPWTGGGDIRTVGGVLHYATLGSGGGEPLVLLPKVGGWIADWRGAAPALAARRRVIAFDPPGHGRSLMDGPPPYALSVSEIAAMVLAALDEMGIDRCAIAGNSLGGIVGIVAAACWPERVSRLVVISSSLIGTMTREALEAQDAHPAAAEAPVNYAADGRPLPLSDVQTQMFGTIDPRITAEQDLSRIAAGPWLRAGERGVGRVGVTDYLPRIQAPTLLINADRGRYTKYAEVGARLIPRARSIIVTGSGSFVHQEKPAEVAAAINAFLA